MPSQKKSVNVRLEDDMFEVIKELSDKYGRSRSEIIRLAIEGQLENLVKDKYTKEQYLDIKAEVGRLMTTLGNIESSLIRIGNNINQIARKVNSGDSLKSYIKDMEIYNTELNELKVVVENVVNEVRGKW